MVFEEKNHFGVCLLLLYPYIPQLSKCRMGKHKQDHTKQTHVS